MTRARRRIAANVEGQRHRDALAAVKADYERRRDNIMAYVAEGSLKPGEAARIVGVSPATIHRQARKLGINPRAARANYLAYIAANASNFAFMFDIMMRSGETEP